MCVKEGHGSQPLAVESNTTPNKKRSTAVEKLRSYIYMRWRSARPSRSSAMDLPLWKKDPADCLCNLLPSSPNRMFSSTRHKWKIFKGRAERMEQASHPVQGRLETSLCCCKNRSTFKIWAISGCLRLTCLRRASCETMSFPHRQQCERSLLSIPPGGFQTEFMLLTTVLGRVSMPNIPNRPRPRSVQCSRASQTKIQLSVNGGCAPIT